MHRIAVLTLDQVIAFDLAIPCQVFGSAFVADGQPAYDVRVCSAPHVTATNGPAPQFRLSGGERLEWALQADTIIVPGLSAYDTPPPRRVVEILRAASDAGVRIASICTAAFVLAATGLLDDKEATTHWERADELARYRPAVRVNADVLFVDHGGALLTSAGLSAGIDMCLYMVEQDHGAAVAADAARRMVMPMVREGGQAQYIVHRRPPSENVDLELTLQWIERRLAEPLTLQEMAAHAMTSIRTLNRRFREEVGVSPMQYLLRLRVQRARELLETTDLSVERIAEEVGFGQAVSLRQHFVKRLGVSPQRYRASYRADRAQRLVS